MVEKMDSYCEKCGHINSNSMYCEECGLLTSILPSSFSTEESLAGLIVSTLNNSLHIKFSEVLKLESNKEKIYRIFSQLETTGKYFIKKEQNDYILTKQVNSKVNYNYKKELVKCLRNIFEINEKEVNKLFL